MKQNQVDLPALITKISGTLHQTQEILQQIQLPPKEINLRIETFFNQILQVCSDFEQTQQKFLEDLKVLYDKIATENQTLKQQLKIEDKDLNQIFQIETENQNQFSYQIYSDATQINTYLKQTLKDRYQKLVTLLNQIQVKCSILDQKLPENVFQILKIQDTQNYQHEVEYFQLENLTLQQIEQINQINIELDQKLAPLIENTQKLSEQIKQKLQILDRMDLSYYYQNCEQLGLTQKYVAFIDETLKGNLQPKFDQQLIDFNQFIQKEVEERENYTQNVIKQIAEMTDNIQISLSIQIDESLINQQIPAIWEQSLIDSMKKIQKLSTNPEDFMNDEKHNELRTQYEEFATLYQQQVLQAVHNLYDIKQVLMATISKQDQHLNGKEQLQPTTNQIRSLVQQIQQIQIFIVQFQPVKELLVAYHENLEKLKELRAIQSDTTRYTSKSREGVAKRRREEQLKKMLFKEYPIILAKLSCTIKEMEKQERKQQGLKISEILGHNYLKQIDSIVSQLNQQDRNFQQKYLRLIMRLNTEAERKMKQSLKSSQVEKSQSQVDKSCFIIKSIAESQIQ